MNADPGTVQRCLQDAADIAYLWRDSTGVSLHATEAIWMALARWSQPSEYKEDVARRAMTRAGEVLWDNWDDYMNARRRPRLERPDVFAAGQLVREHYTPWTDAMLDVAAYRLQKEIDSLFQGGGCVAGKPDSA